MKSFIVALTNYDQKQRGHALSLSVLCHDFFQTVTCFYGVCFGSLFEDT